MREKSKSGLKRYLKSRASRMELQHESFNIFLNNVIKLFDGKISLVLFGSRAVEKHLPSSDYDVMLIVPEKPKGEAYWKLLAEARRCKPKTLPLDLLILEPAEIRDQIVAKMLENALVVYDGLKVFRKAKVEQV